MADSDVGEASCPGKLPRRPQVATDCDLREHGPCFVDDEDRVRSDVACGAVFRSHRLKPRGRADHERRQCLRVVNVREIDDQGIGARAGIGSRRPVEHPGEIPEHEPPELEPDVPAVRSERLGRDAGGSRGGSVG